MSLDKYILLYIHSYAIIQNNSSALNIPLCFIYSTFTLYLESLEITTLSVAPIVLPFPDCHLIGIKW